MTVFIFLIRNNDINLVYIPLAKGLRAVINHVDIFHLNKTQWEWPFNSVHQMQIEGHSTQFLATNPIIVKVRGNKATLGTCPSLEEPKESSQLEFQ